MMDMSAQAPWIQPIQNGETIFSYEVVGKLWKEWNSPWLRHMGIIAVVDSQRRMIGILRPYDILDYLIRQGTEVYHLWPYTHVIERPWVERFKKLDDILAGELIRDNGLVIHDPGVDWVPSISLFAEAMTSVIWISDQQHVLYAKVTLQALVTGSASSKIQSD
jgi:hypothetical protein